MFDEIAVYVHLFPPEVPSSLKTRIYQTKSFECKLDEFRITEEGKLQRYIRAEADNEGGPRRGEWKHHDFTGMVKFYDSVPEPFSKSVWHEFRVGIQQGHVATLIEYAGKDARFVD